MPSAEDEKCRVEQDRYVGIHRLSVMMGWDVMGWAKKIYTRDSI